MLIVSQDKETIINFENTTRMSIIPPEEEGYKYSIAINSCLDLGYYKTKERTKEVLQEIIKQKAMFELFRTAPTGGKEQTEMLEKFAQKKIIFDTYEMPKE
ncbi:MAG: hypothetical protein HFJ53_02070 [Clostridia bacterium]|jgi:hypothetical protein|nr:hypothetical protein [Clostridia bacterium]